MPSRNRLYCDRNSKKYIPFLRRQPADARALQDLFNEGRYYERFLDGEFIACLHDEKNPASTDEPPGTRSLTVYYMDLLGQRICLVHFYLRPDGTIGGRGKQKPDPKMLIHEDVRYEIR